MNIYRKSLALSTGVGMMFAASNLCASPLASWDFDQAQGKQAQENVSQRFDEINYVFNEARFKPSSDPLWRTGIYGSSLMFDGYSNWLKTPALDTKTLADDFSVSVGTPFVIDLEADGPWEWP